MKTAEELLARWGQPIWRLFASSRPRCVLCGKEEELSWVEEWDSYHRWVHRLVPYHESCLEAALDSPQEAIRERAVSVVEMIRDQETRYHERRARKTAACQAAREYWSVKKSVGKNCSFMPDVNRS